MPIKKNNLEKQPINSYKQIERMKPISKDIEPLLIKDRESNIYDNFVNNNEKYDKNKQKMNQYADEISNKQRDILDRQENLIRMNQFNTLAVNTNCSFQY